MLSRMRKVRLHVVYRFKDDLPSEVLLPGDLGPLETLRTLAGIFEDRFSVLEPAGAALKGWSIPDGVDLVIYVQNDYD